MLIAMFIAAALSIGIGSYPWLLYSLLPFPVDYAPFDASHVIAQIQLLFFGALAFIWLKLSGIYPPELRSVNLDAEWLYRRFAPRLLRNIGADIADLDRGLRWLAMRFVDGAIATAVRLCGPHALSARSWPTGAATVWVAVLLGATLVIYYLRDVG
jgi:multicomponent Na+:H+ antiporter subunit D